MKIISEMNKLGLDDYLARRKMFMGQIGSKVQIICWSSPNSTKMLLEAMLNDDYLSVSIKDILINNLDMFDHNDMEPFNDLI